ncbi:MAG: pilus assembly protein TadE [Sphingobium sp.]
MSRSRCRWLLNLARDRQGIAMTEFALVLPVLLVLGMYGAEIAYMTITHMKVSQIALSVADNAARMEQSDNSGTSPTVTEADVNSVLTGAQLEGEGISLAAKGKVILSSLEVKSGTTDTQYIHWQRCTGDLAATSAYGTEGSTVTSLGSGSTKGTAPSGSAVMFVEVYYRYTGLFGDLFVSPTTFHQEGAFLMRDDRDLASGLTGTKTAAC